MDRQKESASQTAGPYVHIGCVPNQLGIAGVYPDDLGARMLHDGAEGERITIRGIVRDGTRTPLRDALIEIWQADAAGRYPGQPGADPAFAGWGRQAADFETGEWVFETVKPGPVPFRDGRMMAPHVTVWIVA
ncbi:MAG: protocatechuate 3,4-dioxygenase subunit alpha, partial [Pseudomonadota bacterium]